MADQSVTDGTITDKTAPVLADKLLLINSEANPDTLTEMELTYLLKIINLFTVDSAPANNADYVSTYDASAGSVKRVLLNLLGDAATSSQGLTGNNNSGTPNTQYDFAAAAVTLRNFTTGGVVVRTNTGTVTNNVSTAGPAANGRDQSGAFSASSWVHFYWIWNGTTLATVSSATAPPTGPTLPSTYTHWCYIGAIRFNGSSQLINTRIRGNSVYYTAEQLMLSGGSAATETAVDIAAYIPPNAQTGFGKITAVWTHTTGSLTYDIRVISGSNFFDGDMINQASGIAVRTDSAFLFPNVGQNLYYLWASATGTRALYLICTGYTVPNGGS